MGMLRVQPPHPILNRQRNAHPVRRSDANATRRGQYSQGLSSSLPYVGEPMRVYGSEKKKQHAVEATRIEPLTTPLGEVSGTAVIDAQPSQNPADAPATGLLVRADGYRMMIDAKTLVAWVAPLHALSEVQAGDWIEYKGRKRSDGVLVATSVKLSPDSVRTGEKKLRAKNDFDPSAVSPSARQSRASMAFIGIDPKRFPPYNDPAMQARVTSVGEKLIPAYQRDLPDSDPARIEFRFQLIDSKLFRDALTLPSGVILVPHQVVERMQNDSQLAAVLADNIACALEKQQYRMQPASRAATAALIGGAFVPYAGLAIQAGAMAGAYDLAVKARQQSGRVALGLMHNAGYDIDEAPLAWVASCSQKAEAAPGNPASNVRLISTASLEKPGTIPPLSIPSSIADPSWRNLSAS